MQGKLIVFTYWSYKDALVQTYTLPYVRVMKRYCTGTIYLVTLEQDRLRMSADEKNRARTQLRAEGIEPVFLRYQPFGARAALSWAGKLLRLWWIIVSRNIRGIHTWCTPAGLIGELLARSTGRPLVLDSFEPHAEPMVETGEWAPNSRVFRILFAAERRQAHRARAVIGLTESMKDYAKTKYGLVDKPFYIKPALIDFDNLPVFTPEQREEFRAVHGLTGKHVCVCAGKTGGLYYEQELFDFFRAAANRYGERFHAVLLSPTPPERLNELAAAAGFPATQLTIAFVPQHEVYAWMNAADFAVNHCRPVPARRHGTSIKNSEYWACGLPVVLARNISDDSELVAQHGLGAVLDAMTPDAYTAALVLIDNLINNNPAALRNKITNFARITRSMARADAIYRDLYANNY